jgi:hypothetical protein
LLVPCSLAANCIAINRLMVIRYWLFGYEQAKL